MIEWQEDPAEGSSWDICQPKDSKVVQRIIRNHRKPDRLYFPASWVIHADPIWSQEKVELSPSEVLAILLKELDFLGIDRSQQLWASAHRWRFGLVQSGCRHDYLVDEAQSWLGRLW